LIIDIHGHYTTSPKQLREWRARQVRLFEEKGDRLSPDELEITDDEIRESIEGAQLPMQLERDTDITLLSPTAGGMRHHLGDEETSMVWTQVSNDLIYRVCQLFPESFVGVGQLPQSPGADPASSIPELERCINELGFVGVNLSPDPSDGYWTGPPITDRSFYPLYEKMIELDVPAMIHVSASCNPAFLPATLSHFLNGDSAAFTQLATSELFIDLPLLKFVLPHGGGSVPYHWGRFRGHGLQEGRGELSERVLKNLYFDTCVYWQEGMECLVRSIPEDNVLYGSEMIGAVRYRNPDNGRWFDDTKYLLDHIPLGDSQKQKIFGDNALRVYPRIEKALRQRKAGV
jgi:4-oxalmesaconate hydratase